MRLRLAIHRHGLPPTRIWWNTASFFQPGDDTTVSTLLSRVSQVIPLEGATWGLEDYVVEVGGFEILHFQLLDSILKENDEVVIRPLSSAETKERKLAGRVQISSAGRKLIDGTPFGRTFIKPAADRPELMLPPRKRVKTGDATIDRSVLQLEPAYDQNSDDDDEDDDDDFTPGVYGKRSVNTSMITEPSRSGRSIRFADNSAPQDSDDDEYVPGCTPEVSEDEDEDEDVDNILQELAQTEEEKAADSILVEYMRDRDVDKEAAEDEYSIGSTSESESESPESSGSESGSDSDPEPGSDSEDNSSSDDKEKEASEEESSDSQDEGESVDAPSRVESAVEESSAPGKQKLVAGSTVTPKQSASAETGSNNRPVGPGNGGKPSSRARNQRKKLLNTLNRLREAGHVPRGMSTGAFRQWLEENGISSSVNWQKIIERTSPVTIAAEGDQSSLSTSAEKTGKYHDKSGGDDAQNVHTNELRSLGAQAPEIGDPCEMRAPTRDLAGFAALRAQFPDRNIRNCARNFNRAKKRGGVPEDWTLERWIRERSIVQLSTAEERPGDESSKQPTDDRQPGRKAIEQHPSEKLSAGDRFQRVQWRTAFGQANKKWKAIRDKAPTKMYYDEDGNLIEVQTAVPGVGTANEDNTIEVGDVETDQRAWRKKIVLSAVECEEDGAEELPTPDFPFRQDQLQDKSAVGRKRKRANSRKEHNKKHPYDYDAQTHDDDWNGYDYYDDTTHTEPASIKSKESLLVQDLPALPEDMASLYPLLQPVLPQTIIAFKHLSMNERYQPILTDYRTAIVQAVHDEPHGPLLELTLAARDRSKHQIDEETGERILGKFDMPGVDFDDGNLQLLWGELIEPKIIKLPDKPHKDMEKTEDRVQGDGPGDGDNDDAHPEAAPQEQPPESVSAKDQQNQPPEQPESGPEHGQLENGVAGGDEVQKEGSSFTRESIYEDEPTQMDDEEMLDAAHVSAPASKAPEPAVEENDEPELAQPGNQAPTSTPPPHANKNGYPAEEPKPGTSEPRNRDNTPSFATAVENSFGTPPAQHNSPQPYVPEFTEHDTTVEGQTAKEDRVKEPGEPEGSSAREPSQDPQPRNPEPPAKGKDKAKSNGSTHSEQANRSVSVFDADFSTDSDELPSLNTIFSQQVKPEPRESQSTELAPASVTSLPPLPPFSPLMVEEQLYSEAGAGRGLDDPSSQPAGEQSGSSTNAKTKSVPAIQPELRPTRGKVKTTKVIDLTSSSPAQPESPEMRDGEQSGLGNESPVESRTKQNGKGKPNRALSWRTVGRRTKK